LKLESRKELKAIFDINDGIKLKKFLTENCKQLFEERIINSIYLDTHKLDVYRQAVSNDFENCKYRFRFYRNEINQARFEKKLNSYGKKYKIFDENIQYKNSFAPYNIESLYLFPITLVKYKRNYFSYKNIRLTVDEEIRFSKPDIKDLNNFEYFENKIVVEQKILNKNDDSIEKNLIFQAEKYSKFLRSIEKIYPNKIRVT